MGLPVIVLTSAGAALLAKTPIGASIPVTGWKIGTGALPAGANLQNQKELVSPLAEAPIASVEPNENQCLITGQFINTGMAAFDWEETGLFASDPDNGTILFAYGNSFGSGEAIPAGSSQLREIIFGAQLVFDVAANITAVINQGLVFATLTQLNQRIPNSEKGKPNGVATLGADGKLAEDQRPDATGVGAADRTLSNLTDPQIALYNLGAGVRPNLLDNWYFVSGGIERTFPINQKGVTSTGDVEKNTICIDRWKRGEIDGIFTLDAAGLVSDGLNRTHIYQLLEPDYLYGKTVTLSAWTNLGVVFGTTTIPTVQEWPTDERKVITVYEDDSVCLKVILLPEPQRVQIQPEAKTVLTLKAVKLEIGKTQTLAYKGPLGFWNLLDIPNYTTELLKCQRHMVIVNTHLAGNVNFPVNIGMAMSANNAFIPIELPVPMRTTPALSVSGQFCLGTGNGEVDTTLTFSTANDVNCVLLNAAASGLTPGQAVYLRAKNDATAKLILNANL